MPDSSWHDDLSLGVEAVDKEHHIQVDLLDAIAKAVAAEQSRERTLELIDQLVEYTNAHFLAEQLLMRLHAYPLYAAHVTEHDALLAHARAVRRAVADGDADASSELVGELREWLITHIRGMDRTYGEYTAQPGVSPAI